MRPITKQAFSLWVFGLIALLIPVATEYFLTPDEFSLSRIVFSWFLMLPAGLIYRAASGRLPSPNTLGLLSVLCTALEMQLFRSWLSQQIIDLWQITLNPQIFLYIFSFAALSIGLLSFLRKGPKLALIFLVIANVMSLSATTLFHQVIIQGPQAAENLRHASLTAGLGRLPEAEQQLLCQVLRLDCHSVQVNEISSLADDLDLNNVGLRSIARDTSNIPELAHAWKVSSITEADINSNSYVIGYYKKDSSAIVVLDKEKHEIRKSAANDSFAILCIAFHLFWIPMTFALAYRHKSL